MRKFADVFAKVCFYIIAILLGAITLLNVMQVVARYAFPSFVIYWSEDVTIMIVFWIMCLGTPALWLKHGHLTMDIFSSICKNRTIHRRLEYIINIVAFLCGIGMFYGGIISIRTNMGIKGGALRLDESTRYIPLPILGAGLSFAAIICILELMDETKEVKQRKEEA